MCFHCASIVNILHANRGIALGFKSGVAYVVDEPVVTSALGHHAGLFFIYMQVGLRAAQEHHNMNRAHASGFKGMGFVQLYKGPWQHYTALWMHAHACPEAVMACMSFNHACHGRSLLCGDALAYPCAHALRPCCTSSRCLGRCCLMWSL